MFVEENVLCECVVNELVMDGMASLDAIVPDHFSYLYIRLCPISPTMLTDL